MKYLLLLILALPACGAPITLTLDFDGNPAEIWDNRLIPATPAYTGDAAAVVAMVAENFRPFNVIVTTGSAPGVQGQSVRAVIGGSGDWFPGATGVTNLFEIYEPQPTVWVFPGKLNNRADLVAAVTTHELGHAGGLEHQSTWVNGVKTAEYAPGYFMGDTSTSPLVWGVGTSSSGQRQDDKAILNQTYGVNADEVIAPDSPETIWGSVGMLGVWLLTRRRRLLNPATRLVQNVLLPVRLSADGADDEPVPFAHNLGKGVRHFFCRINDWTGGLLAHARHHTTTMGLYVMGRHSHRHNRHSRPRPASMETSTTSAIETKSRRTRRIALSRSVAVTKTHSSNVSSQPGRSLCPLTLNRMGGM